MTKNAVFLLHNRITSYRLPLFLSLAKEFDLRCMFYDLPPADEKRVANLGREGARIYKEPSVKDAVRESGHSRLTIVSADFISPICWLTLLSCWVRGKPVLMWSEVWSSPGYGRRRISTIGEKVLLTVMVRFCSDFVVPGPLQKLYLRRRGVADTKIHVIPNVSDMQVETRSENRWPSLSKRLEHKNVVLYFARVEWLKGLDILLRAFSRFGKRSDVVLVVGGNGSKYQDYVRLSKELGISNIEFLGPIAEEDRSSLFGLASVYVLPSRYDAYANSVIEALMMSKPVIVSDGVGCYPDTVHGNGFVFRHGDEQDLYNKMILALNSDLKEMGENSRKLSEGFTQDSVRKGYIDTIAAMLSH